MRRHLMLAAGLSTLFAAVAMVAEAVASSSGAQAWDRAAGIAFNLLLVPAVFAFWRIGGRPAIVIATAAAICGIGSLLMWAGAFAFQAWSLEPIWISLSAVWWIGLGLVLVRSGRLIGWLTLTLGVAAVLDVSATTIVSTLTLPQAWFGLIGGWKLPLQLVWTLAAGVWLTRFALVPARSSS